MVHEARGDKKLAADLLPQGDRDHSRAGRQLRSRVRGRVRQARRQARPAGGLITSEIRSRTARVLHPGPRQAKCRRGGVLPIAASLAL
jgi:hypothetical protein